MTEDSIYSSIGALLSAKSSEIPNRSAILAPDRLPLYYSDLMKQVNEVVSCLRSLGIENQDRVALVLPNGPDLAVAFLAVSSAAVCVPVADTLPEDQYRNYLENVGVKALVLQASESAPAGRVARELGIPVLILKPSQKAGAFTLACSVANTAASFSFSKSEDAALVLHTSGTAAQPKRVLLTQANLLASSYNHCRTLQLEPKDRCLNVMPLTHIHGLVSALLSTVCAGASICCTPGYQAAIFHEWLETYQPTWYTASPTFHQAVIRSIAQTNEQHVKTTLRFIRSAAAPLPIAVKEDLERIFQVPVIESYGMTEAAAQICSNPLPPEKRLSGSVGRAAGPEVAIMDSGGALLPIGQTGEVVIRGENVINDYENNPNATADSFIDGWFRTGDLGRFDESGYLFLKGRISEIVNRGGKKIGLREVDEALMAHPEITEAVSYAVSHPTLGQDIAAVVVVKTDATATANGLRADIAKRIPDYMIPSQLFLLDSLPVTAVGKLQRHRLAEEMANIQDSHYVLPLEPIAKQLASIWSSLLDASDIGMQDNFFALGGDSLTGQMLVNRLKKNFGVKAPANWPFIHPTLEEQFRWLQQQDPWMG